MPQPQPFTILCTPGELKEQLRICRRSEYQVTECREVQLVIVVDGKNPVLSAQAIGAMQMVKLYPRYYTHPFGNRRFKVSPKKGGAPP